MGGVGDVGVEAGNDGLGERGTAARDRRSILKREQKSVHVDIPFYSVYLDYGGDTGSL